MNQHTTPSTKHWLLFASWIVAGLLLFWTPFAALFHLAWTDATASHILLIPFVCAWLIYLDHKQLPSPASFDISGALLFLIPSALLATFTWYANSLPLDLKLTAFILALVLFFVAGFIGIFGKRAARLEWFPLAFLLFLVPFPNFLLDRVVYFLQAGSADIAEYFFDLSGVPVLREGFFFRLPKFSIEVAQECSGIRSSIALLILALLVAHFAFRPFWKKALFVFAGLLMMLLKNGIRIAVLTILANYVNPDFLLGRLHHQGGIVFFLVGLALLFPVYWLLKRGEPAPSPTA